MSNQNSKVKNKLFTKGCVLISVSGKDIVYECSCKNISNSTIHCILMKKWGGCNKCSNQRRNNINNMKQVLEIFEKEGNKVLPNQTYKNRRTKIEYLCVTCKKKASTSLADYIRGRKGCKTCAQGHEYLSLEEINSTKEIIEESGEIWKRIQGGWISSLGRAKNLKGKILTLCPTKFRYHINKKQQYASRLVAIGFKIEGYQKLEDGKYCVIHIDNNPSNNSLYNLRIGTKEDVGKKNGKLSRKSKEFKEKNTWTLDKFSHLRHLDIEGGRVIFENGEIWSKGRFLTLSKDSGKERYKKLNIDSKGFKVHRLVCFYFNPIKGRDKLEDYKDLQVNHKDGDTFNNNASNLEWVTQSNNMKHAYKTGLNKKKRGVIQLDKDTKEVINRFSSMAEASRETGEKDHRIRASCKGGCNPRALYDWEYTNKERTEEYSKKYSKK